MIYFVQPEGGGPIKIGKTVRLTERLQQLCVQTKTKLAVLGVMDGGFKEEHALHRKFASFNLYRLTKGQHSPYRRTREWFLPDQEILDFIAGEARPWDGKDESPPAEKLPTTVLRVPEHIRRLLYYHAASRGLTVSEFVERLVEDHFPLDIEMAKAWVAQAPRKP